MKRSLLFLLSCCMLTATYAQETETERYTVSGGLLGAANFSKFHVDGENPTGVDYETKTSWALGAWVNFPLGSKFSLEPQLLYSTYQYSTNTTTPVVLSDGKLSYISIPLLLKFHPADAIAISFGPQVDFLSSVDDEDNVAVRSDFNKTSFSLSGGLEVFPRGRVTLFGRYIHGMSNLNESAHSPAMKLENRNIQVGLKLRLFGGKSEPVLRATDVIPDTDGDGINDQLDKCPNVAGLAKYDGCPIPDTDGDGINDEMDKCPNVAGTAKYEGCPVPDTDGDGINDELDKCPTQAGPADRNGCPVTDRDNDGINDDLDKCPDIAGTSANNGCPEVPANVTKSLLLAQQGIAFGTNNSTLTTKSNTSLNQLVTLMQDNPSMKIRIESHTSNVGDADDLEDLTDKRAKAIRDYLVSKGIDEDRIEVEGYGGTMPIADNNTAAGRTKNNRIEIKVVY